MFSSSRMRGLVVVAVVAGSIALPTGVATAAKTSSGLRCTIVGTNKKDVIRGTSRRDVICGRGGNDVIYGLGGNDIIDGGGGSDVIDGGGGNDTLIGGTGSDTLDGASGVDVVSYAGMNAPLSVTLDGQRNDGATGERDLIRTAENVIGGNAADTIVGDGRANAIDGGGGNDDIDGGTGNDNLNGGGGNDDVDGGPGDDFVGGGPGGDDLDGGPGRNVCEEPDHPDDVLALNCDSALPVIEEWTWSSTVFDTSQSSQLLTVQARITDNLSGVASVGVDLTGPSGATIKFGFSIVHGELVSGDALDGIYETTVTLPRFLPTGEYSVSGVFVVDNANNMGNLDVAAMQVRGLTTSLSQTGPGDLAAPVIRSWSLGSATVDTTSGPVLLPIQVRITDDLSGFDMVTQSSLLQVTFAAQPIVNVPRDYSRAVFHWVQDGTRLSGDGLDGTYGNNIQIPRHLRNGTYRVYEISISDAAGNTRTYNRSQVLAAGLDLSFVKTGTDDSVEPALEELTLSSREVSNGLASQTIYSTVRLTDNLSGIKSIAVWIRGPGGNTFTGFILLPGADASSLSRCNTNGDAVPIVSSLDSGPATIECTFPITIARFAPGGTYQVIFAAEDMAGNWLDLSSSEIASRGFPATITVVNS